MKTNGKFIRYYLPYKEGEDYIPFQVQAQKIIDEVQLQISKGEKGVAITYSANYGQTLEIAKVYAEGGWKTETNGSNQAAVISSMEELLETQYCDLQGKLRIAPITTMTYTGFGDKSHAQIVDEDLENIETLLENGWILLGWINQDSNPEFAIGGGVAETMINSEGKPMYSAKLASKVQQKLLEFEQNFPAKF